MIVKTKLCIPFARNELVDRTRLMRLLDEGMGAKLTLISAPAGYGKTTALSEWARRCGSLVAWVSLDKRDDDWVLFWSYVTASIQGTVPDFGKTVWPLLESGPSASSVSLEPAMAAILNEMHRLFGELVIILDDYHLIEFPAIQKSLSFMLEHLPPHVHLYIVSRADLPIPTGRLLAKGEMRRITLQDLRFGPDEGLVFFRTMTDLLLTSEQVEKLYRHTEGWISGLQLAAISLKRSGDIAETIRQFSGHQHHISDYLLEEVFRHQPEELRDFLLRTSVLNRMNHSLCEAVTGQVGGQEQLEKLEHSNLFIIPLDDQRKWYRYHHLLSDFLQQTFSRTDPDGWAQAHVRAAKWLESHDFEEEAAEHYLAGQQYDEVVRLIEKNLYNFTNKKSVSLSKWILQAPESFLFKRPMVEIFYLHLMVGTRQWSDIPRKVEQARIRFEALQGQMNEAEWKEIIGNIYIMCAVSFYMQKDLEGVAEYFIRADQYLTEDSLFQRMGRNKHFGAGEFDDHLAYINDYHKAAVFLRKMIEHWGPGSDHPYAATMFASNSKLLYEWNRLEEAEACIGQVMRPNGMRHNPRNLFYVNMAAARIQQGMGNLARAHELMEQLKRQIDSPDYELFMRRIEAEQACLNIRQGSMNDAMIWLERCGMAHTDEVSIGSAAEYMALAKVLAACGREEHALLLSERLYALLTKEDRLRDRIRLLILQSVTLHRIGRTNEALACLQNALSLAKPEGFVRSFVDEGPFMAELLSAYLQASRSARSRAGNSSYAQRLLQTVKEEWEVSGPGTEQSAPGRLQVKCFGRFKVMGGRGDGQEIRWRTAKVEELMAYLIHHRGKPVDRYRILDDLWGDDSEKTGGYFNSVVYHLRKSLNSIGMKDILQHSRGCYCIDVSELDCDYFRFEERAAAGEPVNRDNLHACEEIEQLYTGPYLEGNDYAWAEPARQNIESHYVDLLLRISDCHLNERNYPSAISVLKKTLKHAPWNEEVHSRLIRAYLSNNDRISAMKQYDSLKRTLFAELRLKPSDEVKKLLGIK